LASVRGCAGPLRLSDQLRRTLLLNTTDTATVVHSTASTTNGIAPNTPLVALRKPFAPFLCCRLFVEHAVALVITGRPDDAEPLLREAERVAEVDGEDGRFLLGFASTVRPWRARLRGNAPEAVELARRALSLLPEGEVHVRNYAAVRLGDALGSVGDLAAADEAYAEAAEIGRAPRLREARGHGDARQGAG
jgi:hypothetical protein